VELRLETARLIVRRFRRADVADVLEFIADAPVSREVPEIPHDARGVASFIEQQNGLELFEAKKCLNLAIERRSDAKVNSEARPERRGRAPGRVGPAR
jgi:hypothetical protein